MGGPSEDMSLSTFMLRGINQDVGTNTEVIYAFAPYQFPIWPWKQEWRNENFKYIGFWRD